MSQPLTTRVPATAAGQPLLAWLAGRFRYHGTAGWRQQLESGRLQRNGVVARGDGKEVKSAYRTAINKNHPPATQFATLTHELAHLFLGHLGSDKHLGISYRPRPDHATLELEAESVAYIVCRRNEIEPRSATYLTSFVEADTSVDDLDLYQIMRAAGQVETILGLSLTTRYEKPQQRAS